MAMPSSEESGESFPKPFPNAIRQNSELLSPADWWRLEREMSFSRDSSHLVWKSKTPNGQPQTSPENSSCDSSPEQKIWYCVQFRRLCEICLAMPLVGLVACLGIALMFQFDHIQETACKVYNVVPSISAVTGISPGRYLWRMAIAFHLGPRILIVSSYYHYLLSFAQRLPKEGAGSLAKLLNWCFYLQLVEIVGLCGISFVHNREHYPTHEKGFILYLTSSHMSFLLILRIYHVLWPLLDDTLRTSYRKKLLLFVFSFVCLMLMGYFYYRHIIHCDNMAFSVFAFIEYWVAAANMAFYWTVGSDMPNEEIVVIRPAFQSNQEVSSKKDNTNLISNGGNSSNQDWQQVSYDVIKKCLSTLKIVRDVLSVTSTYIYNLVYNQDASTKDSLSQSSSDKKEN